MKYFQDEQLFTDLTPEEAAVVEGGKSFDGTLNFDELQKTGRFTVSANGRIQLVSDTHNTRLPYADNPTFYATPINYDTGYTLQKREVSVGKDTTIWSNVPPGRYVIEFRDRKDGNNVAGTIKGTYS